MTMRVFFFNKLAVGANPHDYETWVQERDYPTARAIPSIRSYEIVRLDGSLRDGEVPFEYVEVVEISDLASYRADLACMPGREDFVAELRTFVGESTAVYGPVIE